MTTRDIDALMYEHEEAAHLRKAGWTVHEPGREPDPPFSYCIGYDARPCPVRTPNRRCYFCNKTLRLAKNERRRVRLKVVA